MSATTIQNALRRMLRDKRQLTRNDAMRIRSLVLADGYVSRGDRKLVYAALDSERLDDSAYEILSQLLRSENLASAVTSSDL